MNLSNYIGQKVKVKIDRPLGSRHPSYSDMVYPINYGYVPDTISGDGKELDAYVLGVEKSLDNYEGVCIGYIERENDNDPKLLLCDEGREFSDNEILKMVGFQEKYFKSKIIRSRYIKYYEMHDEVYKTRKENGKVSWDGETSLEEVLNHSINKALERNLNFAKKVKKIAKVLDVGTGAGTCALWLASQGFSVDGADASKTAIEMAKENSQKLNLDANFFTCDLLDSRKVGSYDLIVDSSCLHCIVTNEDRSQFYNFVKTNLVEGGLLFMHSMIESANMSDFLNSDYFFLKDEILWSVGKDEWGLEYQNIDGRRVFPHRRILSQGQIEKEIKKEGFLILKKNIVFYDKNPNTFIALLQKG